MSAPRADRILLADRVWSGVGPRSERGSEAGRASGGPAGVAIGGSRILAVGPAASLEPFRGAGTVVLRLDGHTLLPGFVDAHVHLLAGGLGLSRVDLRDALSPEDLIDRVTLRAAATPPGAWILGGGWDHHAWGGTLPHRSWLDPAAPDHPVLLLRRDLHIGVANGRALEAAAVDASTPDPAGGTVDREPDGKTPTGVLRERALELVQRAVPPSSPDERTAAILRALALAVSRGLTQVHDMGALGSAEESWASLRTLRELRAEGRLPLRVLAAVPLKEREELQDLIRAEGRGDARLRWGLVKEFVDGSLGAATAWFHEPYVGEPENRGAPVGDLGELREGLLAAARARLQPAVHAIGEGAVDWLLDVYDEITREPAGQALRPRIEHAQHLSEEALERLGLPGLVCSVQPAHLADDARWLERRLGPERASRSYAFRSMARAGARLAFGSDWPVAPLDPAAALDAAVARRVNPRTSGDVWNLREALRVESALEAHSLGGARAGGMDGETGSLEPGKRADLVAVRGDPFLWRDEGEDTRLEVALTFVDGIRVWRSDGAPEGDGT